MKITSQYSTKGLASLALTATLALVGCSGQQQQSEEDLQMSEEDEAEGENLGQDDAAEGNGQENYVEGEGENEQGAEQQAADANSETADNFEGTQNGGNQLGALEEQPAEDAPLNNTAGAATPVAAPMNAAAAPMNAAAVPTDGTAPIPGGRVRYVREGGVQVVNAPGGTPVLTLNQGEHPVTWEENGWLRLTTGHYVSLDSMSEQGVPRPTN
jgi:hypothetical protein